ncbi:MAG TPA: hypothetical protein VF326_14440 [Anaerolineaceae bacterium]|jgi:hypothetical protein
MDPENLLDLIQPAFIAWLASYTGPQAVLDQQLLDAELPTSSIQFFLEPTAGLLKVKVKYPDGSVHLGSIALT